MNLGIGFAVGLKEIAAHKFRSFLTMLGVILGVASLMSMFALTAGMARGMRETMQAMGGIERVGIIDKDVPESQQGMAEISPGRTLADVRALRAAAPLLSHVTPESLLHGAALTQGATTVRTSVTGTDIDFLEVNQHVIDRGRWLSPLDIERGHRVAILGSSIAAELWPDGSDPVGKTFLINQRPFTVVGVFTLYEREEDIRRRELGLTQRAAERRAQRGERGTSRRWDPFNWKNRTIAIPVTTMFTEFKSAQMDRAGVDQGPITKLEGLYVRVADADRFEEALTELSNVLRNTHRGIEDFGFDTREEWFDRIESSVRATRMSGGIIAGISLVVGGIGITNIMLASITERIREIGVRRAVGATPRDIFVQILVESAVIGITGGLLGLIASFGLLRVLVAVAPAENAPYVEWSSVMISFLFAFLVGILSGLYPAFRASRLDPIQALRYE